MLVAAGLLKPRDCDWALARQRQHKAPIGHILMAHGLVEEIAFYKVLARQYGALYVDATAFHAQPTALERLGPTFCLQNGLIPIGRMGGAMLIASARPELFEQLRRGIEMRAGPILMAVTTQSQQRTALTAIKSHALVAEAERATAPRESCRGTRARVIIAAAACAVPAAAVIALFRPVEVFTVMTVAALAVLLINTVFLATVAGIGAARAMCRTAHGAPVPAPLPRISLLVPLFDEIGIVDALGRRIMALDYPAELIDLCLIVEAGDFATRAALDRAPFPRWARVVTVPPGTIRTKPRAMNYALDFCDGEIVGILDAEDAPPPDQLLRVAAQFAAAPPETACLQGGLNFYNARASWISRCFVIEYALWFRIVLPGLRALRLAIPLGGTTVYFRRRALEALGRWDAHNVTEDADLGIRLSRYGFDVDILDSVTLEEAPVRALPWIRQRSRWLKGYAMTYAVHMRNPARLWHDMGAWRFAGVQLLFAGTLLGFLLTPFLWSFWLLLPGGWHPWEAALGEAGREAILAVLLGAAFVGAAAQIIAMAMGGHLRLLPFVLLLPVYFAMATLALTKTLVEAIFLPFFWDKTTHGVSQPDPVRQEG
ncbi:glycosyltransferase family 2 protein [Profundibacterium mesophilum]|nr:glycosyltransferase [Profundibacterium mesophilum]